MSAAGPNQRYRLIRYIATDTSTAYVDFIIGCKGSLSLHGATKAYLDGLVKAGRIKIEGKALEPSDFTFAASNGKASTDWLFRELTLP